MPMINAKVKIIAVPQKYKKFKDKLLNVEAIVKDVYKNMLGLSVPELHNKSSEKDVFWFDKNDILYKENNKMKTFEKDAKFAMMYNPAKPEDHTIGVYYDIEPKEGDIVVCDYNYNNNALSVRIVCKTNIDEANIFCPDAIDCTILGIADCTKHFERETKMQRRAELIELMTARAKHFETEAYWRYVAQNDTEMAKLFDEFDSLNK